VQVDLDYHVSDNIKTCFKEKSRILFLLYKK